MKILGIKNNRVVMFRSEECIFCLNCQGACMVDISVITVKDDENPQLAPQSIVT
jgi:hypothetical protein